MLHADGVEIVSLQFMDVAVQVLIAEGDAVVAIHLGGVIGNGKAAFRGAAGLTL